MSSKKPANVYDVLCLISSSIAFFPNLLFFLYLLAEQIQTGWGFPTELEMAVLIVWIIQMLAAPFLIFGIIGAIIAFFKKRRSGVLIANSAVITLTVITAALTVLFEFN